jgi:hypothetical protein
LALFDEHHAIGRVERRHELPERRRSRHCLIDERSQRFVAGTYAREFDPRWERFFLRVRGRWKQRNYQAHAQRAEGPGRDTHGRLPVGPAVVRRLSREAEMEVENWQTIRKRSSVTA